MTLSSLAARLRYQLRMLRTEPWLFQRIAKNAQRLSEPLAPDASVTPSSGDDCLFYRYSTE